MSFHDADQRFWRGHLLPGERLFWDGRPQRTIRLDRVALSMCTPAALFMGLYLAVPNILSLAHGQSLLQPHEMQTDPVIFWGMLAAIGWCVYYVLSRSDIHLPQLTRYALTDRRVLIRTALPWPKLYAKHLTPMTPVKWDGDTPGTITFDDRLERYGNSVGPMFLSRAIAGTKAVGFINIDEAPRVHALMQRVMEGKA